MDRAGALLVPRLGAEEVALRAGPARAVAAGRDDVAVALVSERARRDEAVVLAPGAARGTVRRRERRDVGATGGLAAGAGAGAAVAERPDDDKVGLASPLAAGAVPGGLRPVRTGARGRASELAAALEPLEPVDALDADKAGAGRFGSDALGASLVVADATGSARAAATDEDAVERLVGTARRDGAARRRDDDAADPGTSAVNDELVAVVDAARAAAADVSLLSWRRAVGAAETDGWVGCRADGVVARAGVEALSLMREGEGVLRLREGGASGVAGCAVVGAARKGEGGGVARRPS